MYEEKRLSRSEFVPIRGLQHHIRIWQPPQTDAAAASAGPPQARPGPAGGSEPHAVGNAGVPLVLAHGWMDVAASYQFMVDALSDAFAAGRTILAPDWRGFGLTWAQSNHSHPGPYWFTDYIADLDFLLDHYAPGQPVDLVGHSMGGNIAMLYAGVRPERIRRLVNLEGFGLPGSLPAHAPKRYAKWLDELKALERGGMSLKSYDGADGVAQRLMKTNPRLTPDKAQWLATRWAQPNASGKWEILGDPAHKVSSAQLYRLDEVLEIHSRITAPTLAVEASDDSMALWWKGEYTLEEYHHRLKVVPNVEVAVVQDAGHMLHHDQPAELARLIETFLR